MSLMLSLILFDFYKIKKNVLLSCIPSYLTVRKFGLANLNFNYLNILAPDTNLKKGGDVMF